MSKLGCSLKEAYGDSWSSGPKFYKAQPSVFQSIDPYGPNSKTEKFTHKEETDSEMRIQKLEEIIKSLQSPSKAVSTFKNESVGDILTEVFNMLCSPLMKDRIDCIIRFVLCSLLISNVMELLSINA